MLFNNPTFEAWHHYGQGYHEELKWRESRLVSLGTGAKHTNRAPTRTRLQQWIRLPSAFALMKEAVVNSDRTAEQMRAVARVDQIEYYRFSATNGVCWTKLDDCREKSLNAVVALTEEYLRIHSVDRELEKCARQIAQDYIARRRQSAEEPQNNHRARLDIIDEIPRT
jgi:hypothetical protein